MAITNTIAKLKNYFESWHRTDFENLHASLKTEFNNRINTLTANINTLNTKINEINGGNNDENINLVSLEERIHALENKSIKWDKTYDLGTWSNHKNSVKCNEALKIALLKIYVKPASGTEIQLNSTGYSSWKEINIKKTPCRPSAAIVSFDGKGEDRVRVQPDGKILIGYGAYHRKNEYPETACTMLYPYQDLVEE